MKNHLYRPTASAATLPCPGLVGESDPIAPRCSAGLLRLLLAMAVIIAHFVIVGQLHAQPNPCLTDTLRLNTGWNHSTNSLYPVGAYTSNWTVIADPIASTNEPRPASVVSAYPGWGTPFTGTQWISSYPSATNNTNGTYVFESCFCLTDLARAPRLVLDIYADDSAAVYLNGFLVGSTAMGRPPHPFNVATQLVDANASHFKPGKNCIKVVVYNISSVAMGLDIRGMVTGGGFSVMKPECCDRSGQIMGAKFHDKNCNGKWDQGEPGLPGWVITLSNGQTDTTDAYGNYYFTGLAPGTYTVAEVNQPGWTQTYPASGTHTVTVAASQIVSSVDFGNCNVHMEECFRISEMKIDCTTLDGTTQTAYSLSFALQNLASWPARYLNFTVVSPATGVNVMPNPLDMGVVPPGGWATGLNVLIFGPNATAGTTVKIAVKMCSEANQGIPPRCCVDTIEVTLPDCDDCYRLVEQTIECKLTPAGYQYVWCFNVQNLAPWTAMYLTLNAPGGVLVNGSPSTTLVIGPVAPGAVSTRHCVTISGPSATQGSTQTFWGMLCDRTRQRCCRDSVSIRLPRCPEKPIDCCEKFVKGFDKLKNAATASGTAGVSGLMTAFGPGSAPIIAASATLVSATVNGQPAYGYFTGGSIPALGGAGTLPPAPGYPNPQDITWGPTLPTVLSGAPFNLSLQFSPMAPNRFYDVLRYCIRFRFTDKNCVTCDTVICFTRVRWRIFFGGSVSLPIRPKQVEGGSLAGSGSVPVVGSLHGQDSGSLRIVFPQAPEGAGAITWLGVDVTSGDSTVAIVDAFSSREDDLIFANGIATVNVTANPGETLDFGFRYAGLAGRPALPHRVTFRYALAEDPENVFEDQISVVLRRDELTGGDEVKQEPSTLRSVRTYALHLKNANGSEEAIDRLVIDAVGDATIVAVGPTADESRAVLRLGDVDGDRFVSEEGDGALVSVAPGAGHGPIYITLAGVDDDAMIRFTTLNADGQTISEGEVMLTSPLAAVQDEEAAVTGAMLHQSFPNPTASAATISFSLPTGSESVTLLVVDAKGSEVARLLDGESLAAGEHAVYFDTAMLVSGTYYYSLQTGTVRETRSLQVVR